MAAVERRNQCGYRVETFRMARGENHEGVGILAQQRLKAARKRQLFAFHCAAANHHGEGGGSLQSAAQIFAERSLLRRLDVELQIAAYIYALWGRADRYQAPLILFTLRQKKINIGQHTPQPELPSPVAGKRTVGDARIHHGNAHAAVLRQPQEIRPEFSFRQNHQARLQGSQIGPDGKTKIEREVENVFFAVALARQLLSSGSGGGDEQRQLPMLAAQLFCQLGNGQHFAHGDGVNPNASAFFARADPRRHPAQPLAQPGAILAGARHAQQPPGRAHNECRNQRQIVEDDHRRSYSKTCGVSGTALIMARCVAFAKSSCCSCWLFFWQRKRKNSRRRRFFMPASTPRMMSMPVNTSPSPPTHTAPKKPVSSPPTIMRWDFCRCASS